jgi:hypothetical protein
MHTTNINSQTNNVLGLQQLSRSRWSVVLVN